MTLINCIEESEATGEIKQICIDSATEWLNELAERRDMWADSLDEFLAPDAL